MQLSRSDFDVIHLLKHTDHKLYACFLLSLDLSGFTLAGSYERNIISFANGSQESYPVRVIRVRIKGSLAGHTLSLRPDFLFPYSSYSIRFILSVIYHYHFTRNCIITEFTDQWQISRSTLYMWLKLFKTCSGKWFHSLAMADKLARDTESEEHAVPSTPRSFMALFGQSFLLSFAAPVPEADLKPP